MEPAGENAKMKEWQQRVDVELLKKVLQKCRTYRTAENCAL